MKFNEKSLTGMVRKKKSKNEGKHSLGASEYQDGFWLYYDQFSIVKVHSDTLTDNQKAKNDYDEVLQERYLKLYHDTVEQLISNEDSVCNVIQESVDKDFITKLSYFDKLMCKYFTVRIFVLQTSGGEMVILNKDLIEPLLKYNPTFYCVNMKAPVIMTFENTDCSAVLMPIFITDKERKVIMRKLDFPNKT